MRILNKVRRKREGLLLVVVGLARPATPRSIIHPVVVVAPRIRLVEVVIGLCDRRFLHILLLEVVAVVLLTRLLIVRWLVATALSLVTLEMLMILVPVIREIRVILWLVVRIRWILIVVDERDVIPFAELILRLVVVGFAGGLVPILRLLRVAVLVGRGVAACAILLIVVC
jgi:hypothetical protein